MFDPLIVARAVHFGATAIVAGAIFFDVAIARPVFAVREQAAKDIVRSLTRTIWFGLALAILSGAVWALLLAAKIGDATVGQAISDGTLLSLLTETRFGHVWIARGVFAVVAAAVLAIDRARWLGGAAALLMLGYLAFIGHAGARPGNIAWLQIIADMVHLLAAGFWLGGLLSLALMLAKSGPDFSAEMVGRFSMFGIIAVGGLLLTGAINTWLLTDSIANLPATDYGGLLLIKIGLFIAMVAFASVNRWYWSPRLPAASAIAIIRRNALVELGLGLLVIGIVGALGTLPPPLHQHLHTAEKPAEAAFVHIHDVKAMADVTVLPGRPGPSEIWLQLMKDDFTPLPARAVHIRLSHPGQETIVAEGRSGRVGLWRIPGIDLPVAGVWNIVVEVQTDSGEVALDAPFVLEAVGSAEKQ